MMKYTWALAALMTIHLVGSAQEPTGRAIGIKEYRYAVADLVVPIGGLDNPLTTERGDNKVNWLMEKIARSVAPASWRDRGGVGTMRYSAADMSLVVSQTADVHSQVKDMLETMRRVQNVAVAVELRVVCMSDRSLSRLQTLFPELSKNGLGVLSESQVRALFERVQRGSDGNVLQAPKITGCSGQRMQLRCDGLDANLSAMVAANLIHVELQVNVNVDRVRFEKTMRLADGTTMVLAARENADTNLLLLVTPRVLINLETTAVAPGPDARLRDHRVIQAGGTVATPLPPTVYAEPPTPPLVKATSRLADLLRRYEQACAAGDEVQAHRLGQRALAIDPACFQRRSTRP